MAGRHRRHAGGALEGTADEDARSVYVPGRGVLHLSPDPVVDRWINTVRRSTGSSFAAVSLFDTTRRFVQLGTERREPPTVTELSPSEPLASQLARLTGGPAGPPGRSGPPPTPSLPGYAEAPVTVGDVIVGQLVVACPGPQGFPPDTDATLRDAAVAVSTHLELRLAESEIHRVRKLVSSHHQVHDMIARAAPLREVLLTICTTIERYDPTLVTCVLQLDPVSSAFHSGVGPSLPAEYLAATEGLVIGPNIGTCGPAAWFGQLTICPDMAQDPRWAPAMELATAAGVAHCWSMPIRDANRGVLGTLAFYGRQPREPLPEHIMLMEDWSRVAGIAIERTRSLERLTYDARHDGLTGLPNRVAIFEELDDAIQRAASNALAAVFFVDLDGLKPLNDTFGHDRADQMIREVALRLSGAVGEKGFVGRFGGDEFIVIAEGLTDPDAAGELGADLLEAVARPLPELDSTVVTASIGIALVRGNAVDAREVIRTSDAAMYEAKRSGRDRCVFAEAGHAPQVGRRLRLTRMLRAAETRDELSLVFQPIVSLPTMEVVGALLRWRNSAFGDVSPSEFVPIAEDTGSIGPIGAWALRESCEAMARLAARGHPLDLGVNVSTRQVANPDFPVWVRKTLSHAPFPATRLALEITETALMRPDAATTKNLRELNSQGVRLVLDDFGTGYSSLSWLKQHRFDAIKIDRSFIHGLPDDPGDRAIVAGVIGMARALGCSVTAEGVETEGQLSTLEALGCDRVQGFLVLEPVPEDELQRLLSRPVLSGSIAYS
jgi:diguanylate cyclase (GGDEF)-like protein